MTSREGEEGDTSKDRRRLNNPQSGSSNTNSYRAEQRGRPDNYGGNGEQRTGREEAVKYASNFMASLKPILPPSERVEESHTAESASLNPAPPPSERVEERHTAESVQPASRMTMKPIPLSPSKGAGDKQVQLQDDHSTSNRQPDIGNSFQD
jgi:hypothetical protein